jgi:hypothetical protein
MTPELLEEITDFLNTVAELDQDGDCLTCGQDGWDDNPDCPNHEPYDLPNDEAVESRCELITKARKLCLILADCQLPAEQSAVKKGDV